MIPAKFDRSGQSILTERDKIALVGIGIIAYGKAERMDVRPSLAKY
jgi:hypothetical protein